MLLWVTSRFVDKIILLFELNEKAKEGVKLGAEGNFGNFRYRLLKPIGYGHGWFKSCGVDNGLSGLGVRCSGSLSRQDDRVER